MRLLRLVFLLCASCGSALVVSASSRVRAPVMCSPAVSTVQFTGVALTKDISFAIELDGAHASR